MANNAEVNNRIFQIIAASLVTVICGTGAFFITRLMDHEDLPGHSSSLVRIQRLEDDVKEMRVNLLSSMRIIHSVRETQIQNAAELLEMKRLLVKMEERK